MVLVVQSLSARAVDGAVVENYFVEAFQSKIKFQIPVGKAST